LLAHGRWFSKIDNDEVEDDVDDHNKDPDYRPSAGEEEDGEKEFGGSLRVLQRPPPLKLVAMI
jgi:hypothetical protein